MMNLKLLKRKSKIAETDKEKSESRHDGTLNITSDNLTNSEHINSSY